MPGQNVDAGRPRHPRNMRIEEEILDIVDNNPTRSTRSIGRELDVSHTTVWKTVHEDHQHPYHCTRVEHLHPNDPAERVEFGQRIVDGVEIDPD